MREKIGFLKVSSAVVKVAAWIFLFLGIFGCIAILTGMVPMEPRWFGIVILAIYIFFFYFFYFIAKMADVVIKIASEYKK